MSVTKERIDKLYEEISSYKIDLAPDPTSLGPKYLLDLIATCRNYTNHTARLMNELHREKMGVDSDLRRKELAFKIAEDELLATNSQVRNLPNIADRRAQINLLLRDEHLEIENLKNEIRDLDALEKMVKNVHRELKDTMAEIKTQRALIRDEIDTGRMYGDERSTNPAPLVSGGYARPDDMDEAEIEKALRGESLVSDSAEGLTEEIVPEPEVQPEPQTPEEKIQSFLGSPHPDLLKESTVSPSDNELADLFAGV